MNGLGDVSQPIYTENSFRGLGKLTTCVHFAELGLMVLALRSGDSGSYRRGLYVKSTKPSR
jgi:hypothetical protein